MIIACVSVFNEQRMLAGCLQSIQDQLDRTVVVDGAYADFPHVLPYSTDGTKAIAWCYEAEWIGCRTVNGVARPWRDEIEKRNAYLCGQEGDWYFVIDADERLLGQLRDLPLQDGELYALSVYKRGGTLTWAQRIFQHKGYTRYEGTHYAVWRDGDLLRTRGDWVKVDPARARLLHLSDLRDVERQKAKRTYAAAERKCERGYREVYGI